MRKGNRNRKQKETKIERKFSDSILGYIVCMKCMDEDVDYLEQGIWRRVGVTDVGLDVFCERHGITILSIDFSDVESNLELLEEGENAPCPSCGKRHSTGSHDSGTK